MEENTMKRKLISVLLILSLTLSLFTLSATTNADEALPPYSCGDVNGDGNISITDALEILKYLAGMESIYNGSDVSPTIHDALGVLKYLAGMSDERPVLPFERVEEKPTDEPTKPNCGNCRLYLCDFCDLSCRHVNISPTATCGTGQFCLDCPKIIVEVMSHEWISNGNGTHTCVTPNGCCVSNELCIVIDKYDETCIKCEYIPPSAEFCGECDDVCRWFCRHCGECRHCNAIDFRVIGYSARGRRSSVHTAYSLGELNDVFSNNQCWYWTDERILEWLEEDEQNYLDFKRQRLEMLPLPTIDESFFDTQAIIVVYHQVSLGEPAIVDLIAIERGILVVHSTRGSGFHQYVGSGGDEYQTLRMVLAVDKENLAGIDVNWEGRGFALVSEGQYDFEKQQTVVSPVFQVTLSWLRDVENKLVGVNEVLWYQRYKWIEGECKSRPCSPECFEGFYNWINPWLNR
jgi:hypothetical protein